MGRKAGAACYPVNKIRISIRNRGEKNKEVYIYLPKQIAHEMGIRPGVKVDVLHDLENKNIKIVMGNGRGFNLHDRHRTGYAIAFKKTDKCDIPNFTKPAIIDKYKIESGILFSYSNNEI